MLYIFTNISDAECEFASAERANWFVQNSQKWRLIMMAFTKFNRVKGRRFFYVFEFQASQMPTLDVQNTNRRKRC